MQKNAMHRTLLAVLCAVALSACGGGSSDDTDSTGAAATPVTLDAEGLYSGTLTAAAPSTDTFQVLVLENGEFWTIYGSTSLGPAQGVLGISGLLQGKGTWSNGSFSSTDAKDFAFLPTAQPVSASGTYNATAGTLSGAVQYPSGLGIDGATFSGGPVAGYDHAATPSVAQIAGTWSLYAIATPSAVAVSIAADGSFTANHDGCQMTGRMSPRASGKNVFDVSLSYGGAPCLRPNQPGHGVAITYPVANGKTQLLVAVVDDSREIGTAAIGQR